MEYRTWRMDLVGKLTDLTVFATMAGVVVLPSGTRTICPMANLESE